MGNFIENIKISNFKRFSNLNSDRGIKFKKPNGEHGSGLNILVGGNNSGKTTVISTFTKLKPGSRIFTTEKRDPDKETKITINSEEGLTELIALKGASRIEATNRNIDSEQLEVIKETRVWQSSFSNETGFNHRQYVGSLDNNRASVDSSLARNLASIKTEHGETEIELNKIMRKLIPDFTSWDIISYDQSSGDAIGYKTSSGAFVVIDTALGSGILNLFRIAVSLVSDYEIILIDEPEAFLHPQAQLRLAEVLINKSSTKQIIYTTHSPYMLEKVFSTKASVMLFHKYGRVSAVNRGSHNRIITNNYVAWKAFKTNRHELHSELFTEVYIKFGCTGLNSFNNRLSSMHNFNKLNRSSDITKSNYGRADWPTEETEPVWIRNYFHHPELSKNGAKANTLGYFRQKPTIDDIDNSITKLIKLLR